MICYGAFVGVLTGTRLSGGCARLPDEAIARITAHRLPVMQTTCYSASAVPLGIGEIGGQAAFSWQPWSQ
jgi:hypothetical protein